MAAVFGLLRKKLGFLLSTQTHKQTKENTGDSNIVNISKNLDKNLQMVEATFEDACDVDIRHFYVGISNKTKAFAVFIDGLVDKKTIDDNILKPLIIEMQLIADKKNKGNFLNFLKENVLTVGEIKETNDFSYAIDAVLNGNTTLFFDGLDAAIIASTQGWESRSISEPSTDVVVRGPREGFTETLRTNTALLRRKVKNTNLKLETMKIGRQTKTDVCIAYIKGIANQKIIDEVKHRLQQIDTDSVLESGYIEQFITDNPYTLLPTIGSTEKPDAAAGKILEGRVAIITDGTPFVLTVPCLFVENFQTSEDYYTNSYYATFLRWLRFIGFILSMFSPAIYVALVTFHQEMIPSNLLVTMAAAREGTPFPAVVDVIGMGIVYEILQEAGIRLPRPVGQAVSIVGALVIGESAVSAGLIGAPMVIVIAITAISSFVIPSLTEVGTIMRFYYVFLAGFLGLFGIMIGVASFISHLASLHSFGVPYLSPLAPIYISDLKDTFIRVPWWAMKTRPKAIVSPNGVRQESKKFEKPTEEENNEVLNK
jgi:spore germination protein KA